ncbi:hypothetical protein [Nibribacter koreensis]|uniref:YceI-like domain-containing protein n=1 Tax=Nibribacter koreensis TaxID=1084519 RepID=A0ABP8F523_9BACT
MKNLYLLLLFLASLTACGDKEDDAIGLDYPATFTLTKHSTASPVRMFTANGEVKDQAVIRSFTQRINMDYFSLENTVLDISSWSEQVTFLNGTEAEVKTSSRSEGYEVSQKDGDLLLTAKKESTILSPSQTHSSKVATGILKHKPLKYNEVVLPPGSGASSSYTTRAQMVASLKDAEVHLHQLAHALKSGTQTSYSINASKVLNKFDVSGVALLQATDTLLVQEFVMVGEKK